MTRTLRLSCLNELQLRSQTLSKIFDLIILIELEYLSSKYKILLFLLIFIANETKLFQLTMLI